MIAVQVAVFVLGAALVVRTMLSAIRAFVLPRASNDSIARPVFVISRRIFDVSRTGPTCSAIASWPTTRP